jgi:hypothetical protein
MKKKKVWRYYCEWCKKSGCSGYWMRKHEQRCTMNPNRICGYCNLADNEQLPMTELLGLLPDPANHIVADSEYEGFGATLETAVAEALPRLREVTDNCPACIMAALRQKGIPVPIARDFNFKDECKAVWAAFNEAQLGAAY